MKKLYVAAIDILRMVPDERPETSKTVHNAYFMNPYMVPGGIPDDIYALLHGPEGPILDHTFGRFRPRMQRKHFIPGDGGDGPGDDDDDDPDDGGPGTGRLTGTP